MKRTKVLKLRSHRANGREMDKELIYPFVSGRIRFMSVSDESVPCPFRPVGSFEHVQNIPPDKTDRDVRLMYVRYPLPYGLFGTRALHLLYLSGYYPLLSGGITMWHSSCNTDPLVPILSPNMHCLMVMV